ncbi:hypothetical protein K2173_001265 [Erythroxylum novogranatense]|uniref:Pentatricopeptide repeat-containing protein n=1 Tax=Erythroxylum novogranatense TaxID=1862640 RepID=A0AAV8T4A6_9ROSI|nr:hypothetical protein K2173_001265 [Erythroxylum novogranatense]
MKKATTLSKVLVIRRGSCPCPCSFNFSTLLSTGSPYSQSLCIASLQLCALNKNLQQGKKLHAHLLTTGLFTSSLSCTTSLINMYAKCHQISLALAVFNHCSHIHRNVFCYNAVISGLVSNGLVYDGVEIFRDMRVVGVYPDKFTFPCLIKGFCKVMEVKKIHGLVFKLGLELDLYVGSALIASYLKFELINEANEVFDDMPVRDVGLWNAMVNGYALAGRLNEAMEVVRRMSKEGVLMSRYTVTGVLSVFADIRDFDNGTSVHSFVMKMGFASSAAVCNALIDMYGKCNSNDKALQIFEKMDEKDILSWNSIMRANEQSGDHKATLRLYRRMIGHGFQPDLVTIRIVLSSCAQLSSLTQGRKVHACFIVNGFWKDIDTVLMGNALLHMYAKCGSMRDARVVFDIMSITDVASWNIMIMGYGMHGYGVEALDMFSCMCKWKVRPNEVTFLAILSACSHAGFVNQGSELLEQMEFNYGITPTIKHYACVVDMLGRAGQLEEAYKLALSMPIKTNSIVWRSVLAACRLHENAQLLRVAADHVLGLEPQLGHSGNNVLMSNVFVASGDYEKVSSIRDTTTKQQLNVNKIPGCSWIELLDGTHSSVAGSCTYPKT